MKLHAKISSRFDENGLIEYDVLPGAVFSETYNEELDSGSIVIAHQRRSPDDIKPYDWVRVYDEDGKFAKTMLVDDIVGTQINLYEPYWDYTINLMSETKMLEKIQLPNRQWQHSLSGSRKTIGRAIYETCEGYVPKIKVRKAGNTWGYDWLIDFSDIANDPKFDVPLNDLSLSQPTLRQAITAMMTQIGCIPSVKDGKLTYLDLRAEPEELILAGDTFSKGQLSIASDSYVNELVSQGDSILDSDNACVSETLGFRDRNKVFLKQTENLYLETRYPIYKVTKLDMHTWLKSDIAIYEKRNTGALGMAITEIGDDNYVRAYVTMTNLASMQMTVGPCYFAFGKFDGDRMEFHRSVTRNAGSQIVLPGSTVEIPYYYPDAENRDFAFACKVGDKWLFRFSWTSHIGLIDGKWAWKAAFKYLFRQDITPLCVENGRRSLLDTDFMSMTNSSIQSISDLAKWQYGTVGYNIGGKTIEGWSSTYSYQPTDSWWAPYQSERTVTYIENISNKLIYDVKESEFMNAAYLQRSIFGEGLDAYPIIGKDDWELRETESQGVTTNNFANWFFDIEYQPLNSLSVRYTKSNSDAPIPFQQLDTPSNALSSMDALAAHESDLIDRLGNYTRSVSQYADDAHWEQLGWMEGRPLRIGDDIVFQAVYSFDFNGTAANYFASRSAIMRNYFTSVQTKYRAYQYVDYNEAVVRKENAKVYALLSETDHPDMDEKVWFGTMIGNGYRESSKIGLLSPFMDHEGFDYLRLSVGYQANETQTFKNECSVVTYKTNIILNQEEFDNASAGLAMIKDSRYDDIGGGIPQKWYMWDEAQNSYEWRYVGWMSDISSLHETEPVNPTDEELEKMLSDIAGMPRIDTFTSVPFETDEKASHDMAIVSLVDTRQESYGGYMIWHKDRSEIMNVSLQIEHYADTDDIEFGDYYADSICWKGGNEPNGWKKAILAKNNASRGEFHIIQPDDDFVPLGECVETNSADMSIRIVRKPENADSVRIVMWKDDHGDALCRDVIEFKGNSVGKTYYMRLNDTKTTKVFETDPSTGIKYLGFSI